MFTLGNLSRKLPRSDVATQSCPKLAVIAKRDLSEKALMRKKVKKSQNRPPTASHKAGPKERIFFGAVYGNWYVSYKKDYCSEAKSKNETKLQR